MNDLPYQAFLWTITALSLLGTALNVKKIAACFYIWAAVNTAWIGVDLYQGMWSRITLDFAHLVFAVCGIFSWRKSRRDSGRTGATS